MEQTLRAQEITIDILLDDIRGVFNDMLRQSPYEQGLNQDEVDKRIEEKKQLKTMLKNCTFGNQDAKNYVKNVMLNIIQKRYGLNRDSINNIIHFDDINKMSAQDIFESVLYLYKEDYGEDGLDRLITDYNLDSEKFTEDGNVYFEISREDIERVAKGVNLQALGFIDKLRILTQRIYQLYKGNGVIDEIRDMRIDGVSAGISGMTDYDLIKNDEFDIRASYDSIWIFYHGKSIYMSFLGFGSTKELIRVCKNIYKFNNPGQLSQERGYIVNEMFDGSRVSVARPPFCENWVLFIRKFDSVKKHGIENLITDENAALPIQLIWWIVKGQLVTGVTGVQGSGKTTLLMAMIDFIEPSYNLRVQEMSFELHLRRIYPKRNIVTFRETKSVSGQEGLDFSKKTDGTVNILGEVATMEVASWLIQMAGVGSLFTLFTHHAKTTKDLVLSMRNALLCCGGFSNEQVAAQQVCMALNFDIHMVKDRDGHRYIERITQIVNLEDNGLSGGLGRTFETRDIVRFCDGKYVIVNGLTGDIVEKIRGVLKGEEKKDFEEFANDLALGERKRLEKIRQN